MNTSIPPNPTSSLQRLTWQRLVLVVVFFLVASSGHDQPSALEKIKARGGLIMLTTNGATTYYLGAEGETGFEYELAQAFAAELELPLEVMTFNTAVELKHALRIGQGDFIAAGLPFITNDQHLVSGPIYETVAPTLVYRQGSSKPNDWQDLTEGKVAVVAGKGYEWLLETQLSDQAWVTYTAWPQASIEDVFDALSNELIDYTIADSNVVELNRRFFPAIGVAFELEPSLDLAWAVRQSDGGDLVAAIDQFFNAIVSDQRLAEIKSRHYQPSSDYEPVGTFTFMSQLEERLPALKPLFLEAAQSVDLDWALLAAVGYQESHWDPSAVSPTGVRGVMMLTQRTASQLGVRNRLDPAQSIMGGAKYLRSMLDRLPERIEMPDRLYLALAAYNIGLGHLEDARVITQRQGKNPDRWVDVKEHLPLLTQERWYSQTRFGYARGYEAVNYVSNVRTFYEILLWMDQRNHPLLTQMKSASAVEPNTPP